MQYVHGQSVNNMQKLREDFILMTDEYTTISSMEQLYAFHNASQTNEDAKILER